MSVRVGLTAGEAAQRWPHIQRYLRVDPATNWVDDDYLSWVFIYERRMRSVPDLELAAAFEQWADFFEWRFTVQAEELAGDDSARGLLAEWTDSMTYCVRRSAAVARGENPGEWVTQWERRPDLAAAKRARVEKIIAAVRAHRGPGAVPARPRRKIGKPCRTSS